MASLACCQRLKNIANFENLIPTNCNNRNLLRNGSDEGVQAGLSWLTAWQQPAQQALSPTAVTEQWNLHSCHTMQSERFKPCTAMGGICMLDEYRWRWSRWNNYSKIDSFLC